MIADICSGAQPWWVWGLFILFVIILLIIDLGLFHRKTHAVSIKEALVWAGIWFALAMVFNAWVWWQCGADKGLQFFTGYIVEKSLSVDNLFVILLIFTAFSIPAKFQHRVLFWGILGALVMRGLLIGLGAALVARFDWIFYIFGAFLLWTGFKMFFEKEEDFDPHDSAVVKVLKRFVPVSRKLHGEHFFTRENGRFAVTLLFVALIVVEFTDVIFAFDSIPAIFAISSDPFIVFTSNVFAILGLRSLYFVIAEAHNLFKHLKTGLAIILVFIGLKLLAHSWIEEYAHGHHISETAVTVASLVVVLAILATSIAYSIYDAKQDEAAAKRKARKKPKTKRS